MDKAWLEFFAKYWTLYAVCYEEHAERPHFHALIFHKGTSKLPFTELVQQHFPECTGNSNLAVTNLAPDEQSLDYYKQYVCKGENKDTAPVLLFNSLIEDVEYKHRQYWIRKLGTYFTEQVRDTPEDTEKFLKTVKPKQKTFLQNFILYAREEIQFTLDWRNDNHLQLVMRMLLRKLGEKSALLDNYILERMTNAVFNALEADHFRDDMVAQTLARIRGGR